MRNKKTLKEYWKAANAGVPPELLQFALNREQLSEIRQGFENGVDIKVYANSRISAEKMRTARLLQEMGVKVKPEVLELYNERQLEEIRLGKKAGIDTTIYQNPRFDANDMRTLRLLSIAHKIVESIKEKSHEIFSRIQNKFSPLFGDMKRIEQVTQDELEKEVFEHLQNIDVDQFENLDQLREHILEKVNTDQFEQAVSDQLEKMMEDQEKVTNETYITHDSITIFDDTFALLQRSDAEDYIVVKGYSENNDGLSWGEETHFENKQDAAQYYQNVMVEKLLGKQVVIEEVKKLSAEDQKIQDKIDELANDLKVSDVKRVESFLNLQEGITMEQKLLAYQHANQITYQSYIAVEENQMPQTLEGRYAQTYLEKNEMIQAMKESGIYSCINLDEYGKKLLKDKNVALTEEGFYEYSKEIKDPISNETVIPGKQMQIQLSCDTLAQLENNFNLAVKNYMDLGLDSDVAIKLNVAGKDIVSSHLTSQDLKDLCIKGTFKQSTVFKELLDNEKISLDQIENEVETVQENLAAIPLS